MFEMSFEVLDSGMNTPAGFAAEIRALALDAHRLRGDSPVSFSETYALARRIRRLQARSNVAPSSEMAEWLTNLRGEIEARLIADEPVLVG